MASASTKAEPAASSSLVLNGRSVDPTSGARLDSSEPTKRAGTKQQTPPKGSKGTGARTGDFVAEDVAPPLYTDGTLDDGPDPFDDERATAMPTPIERDPDATKVRPREEEGGDDESTERVTDPPRAPCFEELRAGSNRAAEEETQRAHRRAEERAQHGGEDGDGMPQQPQQQPRQP